MDSKNENFNSDYLFTMYLEFDGGTYISQVLTTEARTALPIWAERITEDELASWKLERSAVVGIAKEVPVSLEGLVNGWCATGTDSLGKQLILNIFLTSSEQMNDLNGDSSLE